MLDDGDRRTGCDGRCVLMESARCYRGSLTVQHTRSATRSTNRCCVRALSTTLPPRHHTWQTSCRLERSSSGPASRTYYSTRSRTTRGRCSAGRGRSRPPCTYTGLAGCHRFPRAVYIHQSTPFR